MSKEDRRVKRTHRLLSEALIALTLEKGYESISIRDITEQADIGYATFFRHYKSKDELLQAALHVLVVDFMEILPDQLTLSSAREKGILLFQYAEQNSDLCSVLLGSRGSSAMSHQLHSVGTQISLSHFQETMESSIPLEIVANQLVASVLALIRWWLDNKKPYSPEKMGEIYEVMVIQPLQREPFRWTPPD